MVGDIMHIILHSNNDKFFAIPNLKKFCENLPFESKEPTVTLIIIKS